MSHKLIKIVIFLTRSSFVLLKDELPEGFSQSLREQENSKSRAKFQDQQQEKNQAVTQTKNPKHEEQQRAKVQHLQSPNKPHLRHWCAAGYDRIRRRVSILIQMQEIFKSES